jgi:predicted amidophosphoribosyltransferase
VLRLVRRAARVLRRRGVLVEVRRLLVVGDRPLDQAGLSAEERRANLQGRFRAVATWAGTPDRVEPPTQVLLVDDVLTTGSTLREAQRALESAGLRPAGAVTLAATLRRVGRS